MQLEHKIFRPNQITNKTPILLLLHGYGSNEDDLFSFQPNIPQDWIVKSYRAPYTLGLDAYYWYDIDFNNPENWINLPQAMAAIKAIISDVENFKLKNDLQNSPIHLAGFSQGGILTYALALQFPHLFRKIAIMSAYPEMKILQNLQKEKNNYKNLNIFISHGVDDAIIPLDWARKAPEFLENLGISFSFREYMSGHGLNPKNYMDLMNFFVN